MEKLPIDLYGPDTAFYKLVMAIDYFSIGLLYSERLNTLIEKDIKEELYFPSISAPASNFLFSIEIALKALLIHQFEIEPGRTHDIKALYNIFPKEFQQKIYNSYRKSIEEKNFENIRNFLISAGKFVAGTEIKSKARSKYANFDLMLNRISLLYMESRYLYQLQPGRGGSGIVFPFKFCAHFGNSLITGLSKIANVNINLGRQKGKAEGKKV